MTILPRAFLRRCRQALLRTKVADTVGGKLSGGKLLLRTMLMRRVLHRMLGPDEKFVGILMPPSVGGVLANAVLSVTGRVSVNLNFTLPSDTLNYCCRQAGIRHILTSHLVMHRMKHLSLEPELIFMDELKQQLTPLDRVVAGLQAYVLPLPVLERQLGLHRIQPDDLLTVIFTSGSTGQPKGVMLTHGNIASNTEAIEQVARLSKEDVVCGVLPFFHSFGFTITLWTVLGFDIGGVYHYNPLDAKVIGKMCHDYGATVLMTTPTFLRSYLRRCDPVEFSTLDIVVAGAEKLPSDLAAAFEEKFGVRPVEGYGTTELSPLVSVNIPPSRALPEDRQGLKEGSVGRPVPGVAAKVVHPETGQDLEAGQSGLLLIKGPNVMKGYLKQPELTAEVIHDGWYRTGDVAFIDAEGFIHITGRQSRFSKIGGEMVPHIRVEELLQQIASLDDQKQIVAVTALPDERKGERLIVLHTAMGKSPEQLCKELSAAGLPNLWIPTPDAFYQVDEIPILGTGKLDLQALNRLAKEKAGVAKGLKV